MILELNAIRFCSFNKVCGRDKQYINCIAYNIRPRLSSIHYSITQHYKYIYISNVLFPAHERKYSTKLDHPPDESNYYYVGSCHSKPHTKMSSTRTSYIHIIIQVYYRVQSEIEYCTAVSHDEYICIYIIYLQLRIDCRGHLFGLLAVFLRTLRVPLC